MSHFYKCSKSLWIVLKRHSACSRGYGLVMLSLLVGFLFPSGATAQQGNALERRVTVNTAKVPLAEALAKLEQAASVSFAYADDSFNTKEPVRLRYNNVSLAMVLQELLGVERRQLRVQGNTIHIGKPIANTKKVVQHKPKTIQDTTKELKRNLDIDPVVVTGQFRPQSVNKSVYKVDVIDKRTIENMAVNNIGEVLRQQLNIEVSNQSGSGRSKIRVLGLNSQYTKILMDNIPIAGDENMGSDVDLSTLSMDDVERIEIVKGAMGVDYGANSIAGVVNIITKKRAEKGTDMAIDIQEETVDNEYNWHFVSKAKGKHLQKLNISHNITDSLSIGGSFSHERFNGYWGDYKGAGVYLNMGPDPERENWQGVIDDRGYDWSPKTSYNGNAYVSYQHKHFNVFYKFNLFRSDAVDHTRKITRFMLPDEKLLINASINDDYRTTRYNHHLNFRGDFWGNAYYSLDASYQKNGVDHRRQGINLFDNSVINPANGLPDTENLKAIDWEKYYQSQGFYSKATVMKPLWEDKLDVNVGYEMDQTKGNQGQTSFFSDVALSNPVERTLFTGAAYASLEWKAKSWVTFRPGFRMSFSSKMKTRNDQSLTTRFTLDERNDLRVILGTSTRFPNYEEMFSWFVQGPHDFRGNPDLRPEDGKSAELVWSRRQDFDGNVHLESNLSGQFQYIEDRIVDVQYPIPKEERTTPAAIRYTFENEKKYKGLQGQANVNLISEKFHFSMGASFVGYRGSDDADENQYGEFLTNFQANAQATYVFPGDYRFALFYRYTGRQPQYVFFPVKDDKGETISFRRLLTKTEAYHGVDINVAKSFFDRKLDVRVGVKNLAKVTDINYMIVNPTPDIVSVNQGQLRLYYGRMWFVKLTYRIFS